MTEKSNGRPVVICTERRGVFFGYTSDPKGADPITLNKPRMCVRWSQDVHGVVGLAATGPTENCRITASAKSIELRGITCVMDCTDDAAAAWERGPWN